MKLQAGLLPPLLPTIVSGLSSIPSVPYNPSGIGFFPLSEARVIGVDSRYASARDGLGSTLIPPSLLDFAVTFSRDVEAVLGFRIPVSQQGRGREKGVFLTIDDDASAYTDIVGRPTSEGYSLTVNSSGIFIAGASPLGIWWATRTVLHQGLLHGRIPHGRGRDSPAWRERGMMLDAGRHFYPTGFLQELCAYMSFFKQNILHLHLSDNLYNNHKIYTRQQSLRLGAWFRLRSDAQELRGLSSNRNESYARSEMEDLQLACASRGVTVVPELEAPGHALPIVQWRPQLGLSKDLSQLNISHPETMPTVKMIWRHFLPWFHSKVVSIGADEYAGPVEDYVSFVNSMNVFIQEESNRTKAVRIWGTFPPSRKAGFVNVHDDVSIQHWSYHEDNPYHDFIRKGYSVVNSIDDFYVVSKWGSNYPNTLDPARTFDGDPDGQEPWYPHIFNMRKASDNARRDEPRVIGAITPLWNDYGPNASVYSEAYYAWRRGLPALADKQWGGRLTSRQFDRLFTDLYPHAPAQNLERRIPSKGDVIFEYDLGVKRSSYDTVKDLSPNGYDATTDCMSKGSSLRMTPRCQLVTPWKSKGRDYTLTVKLVIEAMTDPGNTKLIVGADSVLMLTPTITLLASGTYHRLKLTMPLGEWVELSLRGRGNQTFVSLERMRDRVAIGEEEFRVVMGINGERLRSDMVAIEAPVEKVTGWRGQLRGMRLTRRA
ncbi:glycoside hydrolase family 20 protein [Ophiocordyceps camponoti-floridani]|uniref:beta-N-acetylhexosaminidase n=1 Tax=Ophiocordyceps camponoti-floridani TaxID=2030778 RepID=A0A8H4QAM9_9HYPO|nr:glycoside hydrolase family 20 protein [Ophiocordyceps camponoti-floridani]